MEQRPTQKVHFNDETIEIEIVTIQGIEYLRLEDVQRRFPSVTALFIGNRQLAFVTDENGHHSEPLRVKAYLKEVIDGKTSETSSDIVSHGQFNRTEGKIDRVDANTQEILTQMKYVMIQMYKLHEYTTPRYFFILPAKQHDWTMIDTFQNCFHFHYKLYFLCECSDGPKQLHIALHDGYSIRKLKEFITRYGPYLQTILNVLKVLLSARGDLIPPLVNESTVVGNTLPLSLQSSDNFVNIKEQINRAQTFLDDPKTKLIYADSSFIQRGTQQTIPIQDTDLRQLESYLERIDSTQALGNLYRTVTDDGHVCWVCQQHYDAMSSQRKNLDFIKQIETMGGKHNQENKELIFNQLKVTKANVKILADILIKGFNVSKFLLDNCSMYEGDFDKLIDIIINRSSIHHLQIHNLNIHNYFGSSKYICTSMHVSFSNHLLNIRFNDFYQDGKKNLFIRILMQNKIYRTLEISAYDFLNNEQKLKECINTNTKFTKLIVNYANNIDIFNVIFTLKNNRIEQLKLNNSLLSSSVAKHFCQLLKTNQTLIELDLVDSTDFSDKDFLHNLFHILKQHKSIKQLRLHISSIENSDEKQTLLIDVLKNYQFLTDLCLSKSNISSELVQIFIDAIKQYHSLIHLEFYLCHLNQNDIEQLKILENDGLLFHLVISEESRLVPKSINDQQTFDHFQLKSNLKWKLNAKTIAGGNDEGDQLNQLKRSQGIYVDHQQQSIYIADCSNHRIVKWKLGENNGQIVAGGNGHGYRIDQLKYPTDVTVDQNNKSLIICDRDNRRVVRWSLENQQDKQIIIEDISCSRLMMHENGDLFVSDLGKHEVKRWKKGEKEGTVVAGGNACGNQLDQLKGPTFLFIDRQETVYVSDYGNHRVMKWMKGAKEGIVVAGGRGQGNSLKQLSYPQGLIVNEVGDVYVADDGNDRIMCWPLGSQEGHVVVGGNGKGQKPNQFNRLGGLSFDGDNNLYVVDNENHRIQQFEVDKN